MDEDDGVECEHLEIPTTAQSLIGTGIEPLTAFRVEAAMSIVELARASGVAAERIEDFEAGKGGLLPADFGALGKVLALPPEWLRKD